MLKARIMVAHNKYHKPARNSAKPAKRMRGHKVIEAPPLPVSRPPVKAEEFPKDDEEPKPEDLAKEEEALKAEEAAEQAAAQESEEHGEARHRDRSSYDGDTAIKLYLR